MLRSISVLDLLVEVWKLWMQGLSPVVTHLHYSCTRDMVSSVDFIIRQMGMVCSPSSWAGAAQGLLLRRPRPLPLPLVFVPSQPQRR